MRIFGKTAYLDLRLQPLAKSDILFLAFKIREVAEEQGGAAANLVWPQSASAPFVMS